MKAVASLTAGSLTVALAFLVANGNTVAVFAAIAALAALALSIESAKVAWLLYFASVCLTGATMSVGPVLIRPEMLAIPLLLIACTQGLPLSRHVMARNTRVRTVLVAGSFIVVMIVSSSLNAPLPTTSLWIAAQLSLGIFAFFVLQPQENSKLTMITTGTAVIGTIAGISVLSYIARFWLGAPADLTPGVALDGRLIGFSFETNIFASQCVGWLALMYVWRKELPGWTRWVSGLLCVAVIMAGTRAAWIALALIVAMLAVHIWRKSRWFVPLAIASVPVAVLGSARLFSPTTPGGSDDLLWRVTHLFDVSGGTGAYRADIYATAISDIDSPARLLFGTGMNSFSQFHLIDATGVSSAYLSSLWYAMLYDVGLVGLTLFITLLAVLLKSFRPGSGGGVVLAVLLVCASTTNMFWLAYAWVYLGLVPAERILAPSPTRSRDDNGAFRATSPSAMSPLRSRKGIQEQPK